MIDLTPLDVRKKKEDFRRAVRGYDPSQVDGFLDLVAERLEALVQENRRLEERAGSQEERLSAYRERETALNEALLAAQELREEARAQAQRESALRVREAELEAEALRERAERAMRESQGKLAELRARRIQLLRGLRATLERFMEEVAVQEERLAAEPESPAAGAPGGGTPGDTAPDAAGGGGSRGGEPARPAPTPAGTPAG